jgi:hypothetical protein
MDAYAVDTQSYIAYAADTQSYIAYAVDIHSLRSHTHLTQSIFRAYAVIRSLHSLNGCLRNLVIAHARPPGPLEHGKDPDWVAVMEYYMIELI